MLKEKSSKAHFSIKSKTKKDAKVVEKEEFQKILRFSKIPIVVIGGINENTIPNFKNTNI